MEIDNEYLEFARTQHQAAQIALESTAVQKDKQLRQRMEYAHRYWMAEIDAQITPDWRDLATQIADLVIQLGEAEPPAFGLWQKLHIAATTIQKKNTNC